MRLRQQMELLLAGGVHQAVVLNLAPSGPLYGALADEPAFFTDAWWEVFSGVCRDAQELGFRLWFYDQLGFSGADIQGQLVGREPGFRGQALERGAALPPGADWLTSFDEDGETVVVYAVPRGFDYLDGSACAALLDTVHGEFERRVRAFLGSTIVGSFQDELPSMPTWSAAFAEEFRIRRGYDLVPLLAALWGQGDPQVRVDYQRTRAELAEEAFFVPLHQWHEARGLVVGCDQQHPARAGYPLEATQQYGDYLRTHRWFSAPGSDHWGDAKVHSSLAHLYDRPRTWVEAFHSTGWGGTLEETYDWLLPWLRAGATLYDPHAVYYSTRGGRWEWAAPSTCWRQPYWRHYPLFADTVSRLCAALSWGDHVCDVAVLFPTATVQSELDLQLPEATFGHAAGTSSAQDTYLEVVGRMHWYEPRPGVLDRDGRDFDVVDDDSVVRGESAHGGLRIGRETYRAIVLPECSTLEPATAKALRVFAEHGGMLVAIGAVDPELAVIATRVATARELPAALAALEKRVTAGAAKLLRTDGESTLLLVTSPSGTTQPGGGGWLTQGYAFDPHRRSVELTVRDVPGASGPVALWDPGTGTSRPLDVIRDGGTLHLQVPLVDGPCALVVFGPAALTEPLPPQATLQMARPATVMGEGQVLADWTGMLLPTLDNTWGDFRQPPTPGLLPVLLWQVEHRVDEKWSFASVTFGERGQVRDGAQWRPLVWSDSAGGPAGAEGEEQKGYVPEEFLDLGPVEAGAVVDVRFAVPHEGAALAWLSVGSTADKQVRWNGVAIQGQSSPYSLDVQVPLRDGDNLLEVRLTAVTARRLKASWCLRHSPESPRPEWVTGTKISRAFCLNQVPQEPLLQLGTVGRVTMSINGSVVARHGEFDNYSAVRQPRVRRYDVADFLVTGDNLVEIELHEAQAAVVVDPGWDQPELVTNGSWTGVTGGLPEIPHDPRWVQLRPRSHPLPEAHVLEGLPAADAVRVAGPATGDHESAFRFALPPGATGFRLPITLPVAVDIGRLEDGWWVLDAPAAAGTRVGVAVRHDGRWDGGLLWPGPIEVRASGHGVVAIGPWSEVGLASWSGGLRYRTVVGRLVAATLDLGAVRGTAEVRVNGEDVGCRLWSPYSFDLGERLALEENVIEVDIYNTLAPYVGAISPTRWVLPGQTLSGLLGPVVLRTTVLKESP